ncbi:MAG: BspA family leucine-rich repeat surface protein [Flavobacteriaceae bacterium]|nr:BspA family leucine-rich repeat surface protein [Flavobacteriaceae bacterium]
MKKLLLLSALLIYACSDDEGNPCVYEPTLTTQAATNITETSATLNGTIDVYSQNCDTVENILQGFVYSTSSEPTIDDDIVNVDGTSITESLTNLEPNTTYYVRVFLVRPLIGVFYGNEVSFVTEESIDTIDCDVVYLDENGVTIKAYPCAEIGDVGTVNGIEYTVVDRDILDDIIGYDFDNNFYGPITADLTKICTSRITDMSNLIFGCGDDFNQPIGNWDVSNVTDMSFMFYVECGLSQFNQDISHWDVSNVINMEGMLGGSASFAQDLNQWDVSNVTNMARMFVYSSFNQPINNWDVSNVTNMQSMFYDNYQFNQDIIQWDVSNVTDMYAMFHQAYSFNQDLSNWPVENVTICSAFSDNTPQWTLPQPNFTNCNP